MPTLGVWFFDDSCLVLLDLDMQTCRFEMLDALRISDHHKNMHNATFDHTFFVPLKHRIVGTLECCENAFAIFLGFSNSGFDPSRQLFGVFTVCDSHLVTTCKRRVLEQRMIAPKSTGDGQTLLGFVRNKNDRFYNCLLDAKSGEQRALKVDRDGRPVKNGLHGRNLIRSSD